MEQPTKAAPFLIGRSTITIDFVVANSKTFLTATVAGVALHGVDISVLYALHNAYMIGTSILAVRFGVIPIKENDIARSRFIAAILPQSALLEPCRTMWSASEDIVVPLPPVETG